MHQLWTGFAEEPGTAYLVEGDARGREPQEAFEDARQVGTLNGRDVAWMLLIDPHSAPQEIIACYGDDVPPGVPGGVHFYHFGPTAERYPSVGTAATCPVEG